MINFTMKMTNNTIIILIFQKHLICQIMSQIHSFFESKDDNDQQQLDKSQFLFPIFLQKHSHCVEGTEVTEWVKCLFIFQKSFCISFCYSIYFMYVFPYLFSLLRGIGINSQITFKTKKVRSLCCFLASKMHWLFIPIHLFFLY